MNAVAYVRLSPLTGEDSPEDQTAAIERAAAAIGVSPGRTFVDPGFGRDRSPVMARPAGQEMLATIAAGDTIIVASMDRLGADTKDLRETLRIMADHKLRLYVVEGPDRRPLDLPPNALSVLVQAGELFDQADRTLRSERGREVAAWHRERGLPIGSAPIARKIVVGADGTKILRWNLQELAVIADISERLATGETPEKILADLWSRRVKDQRGQPWGQPITRNGSPPRTGFTANLYRRVRWFHDAKRKGKLPPPWNEIAWTIPEPVIRPRPGFGQGRYTRKKT